MVTESNTFGEVVLAVGALSIVTVAITGVLSLGYYGLGLSPEPSALDNINSQRWSEDVKTNIQFTYMYLYTSFYVCVAAAAVVCSSSCLFFLFSSNAMVLVDFFVESLVQHGKAFAYLNSEGLKSPQKLAWFAYCSFLGGLTSPSILFGPAAVKVSLYLTFIIVLVLTLISLAAPVGKFANWDKKLKVFEIVVLIGTVTSSLIPVTRPFGAVAFAVSFYGGLILFQLFFLCHSQEAHIMAYNATARNLYCPPGMSVPMLLDAISIYSRIVTMVPAS